MDKNGEDVNQPARQPSGASGAMEENEDDHEPGFKKESASPCYSQDT